MHDVHSHRLKSNEHRSAPRITFRVFGVEAPPPSTPSSSVLSHFVSPLSFWLGFCLLFLGGSWQSGSAVVFRGGGSKADQHPEILLWVSF